MASETGISLSENKSEEQEDFEKEETEQIDGSEVWTENEIEAKDVNSEDFTGYETIIDDKNKSENQYEEKKIKEQQIEEENDSIDKMEEDAEKVVEYEETGTGTETEYFRMDDEVKNCSYEEILTDDEALSTVREINVVEKEHISGQDETETDTQKSVCSKSAESQYQESSAENQDDDVDSEVGGESDETEVDLDDRQQPEGRSTRETSPTPCPPESPSESAPPMSVASTPDIKHDGVDSLLSTSCDVKNELMLKLDGEINKDGLFQQRFFILASNYDEMIKMKDEYKAENERLRLENMQMKMDNTRIYNKKLESKERENHKLHQTVDYLKRELAETQNKLRTANDDYKNLCLSYEDKILRLVQNLSVAEETLADTVFKLREQELVRSRQERENRRQCERLQKEKNDLMELALSGDQNNFYLS